MNLVKNLVQFWRKMYQCNTNPNQNTDIRKFTFSLNDMSATYNII